MSYHGYHYSIARKRKDGSTGYTAQILIKRESVIVHREAKTFDRKPAAMTWMVMREAELARPGGLERREDPPLSAAIDRYIAEAQGVMGSTKAQVLRTIKDSYLAKKKCSEITSQELRAFCEGLNVKPQTRGNYFAHLSSVFTIARPAWGYPLSEQEFEDAVKVLKTLKLITKGGERTRRPTLDELDRLMEHFGRAREHRPSSLPMQKIVAFALFSTRRQEEITLIAWSDLDDDRILVRDMKHPGDKAGNHVLCELPPEVLDIIRSMPQVAPQIFPYSTDAISAAFTRACKFLQIIDLHFHDLRHEGISRLFEMGRTIPQVATVSGHRSWSSLKRYAHLRQTGDKYAGWKWLPAVTNPELL